MEACAKKQVRPDQKKRDKHVYYERSVQDAASEVSFINRAYKNVRGKAPIVLREDFCGTASVCCEWVRTRKKGVAYGIDLDAPTLAWGTEHNVAPLGKHASRVNLIQGNVLDELPFLADVTAALNFSYFTFKKRDALVHYAKQVRKGLAPDGVFVMDIYGGPDAQTVQLEETDHGDFTYIWDQARYNPVTGETLCHIHFAFPRGKAMRKAFTYDWRLWSLPEMQDVLMDAGFKGVDVYWEGTDSDSEEGNGIFKRTRQGDDASSWIAYLVAAK
jgi:SAM-dependent methyltransferase